MQHALARSHRPTIASRAVASAIAAASVGFAGAASVRFARERTTVDPHAPSRASTLVTDGPNSLTRNPMYLGMAGLLAAHAVWRRSPAALLPVVAFVAVIDRVQVPAEEDALRENFGQAYEAYCAQVPRWLGRRREPAANAAVIVPASDIGALPCWGRGRTSRAP